MGKCGGAGSEDDEECGLSRPLTLVVCGSSVVETILLLDDADDEDEEADSLSSFSRSSSTKPFTFNSSATRSKPGKGGNIVRSR